MKRAAHLEPRGLGKEVGDNALFEEGRGEFATLNGNITEKTLLIGLSEDVLLHCALAYQAVDVHVACLTDSMTSATKSTQESATVETERLSPRAKNAATSDDIRVCSLN